MEILLVFLINVIKILEYAILIRIIMSWISPHARGPFSQAVHRVTEPILAPFRRIIPRMGMIDFSPLAAYFTLYLVQSGLVNAFAAASF